jgi:hypothetical protein
VPETNAGSELPRLMRGASSTRLNRRGIFIILPSSWLVIPLAFESSFKSIEGYYSGILLGLLIGGALSGYAITLWADRKEKLEVTHGYTTRISKAVRDPEIYLVDFKTLKVVSGPHELRPGNK